MDELFSSKKDGINPVILVLLITIPLAIVAYYYFYLRNDLRSDLDRADEKIINSFDIQKEFKNKDSISSGLNGRVLALLLSKNDNLSGLYSANLTGVAQRINTEPFVISDFKHKNNLYAVAAVDKRLLSRQGSKASLFRDIYVSFSKPAFAFSKYKKLNVNKVAYYPSYLSLNNSGQILFVATDKKSPPKSDRLKGWNIYISDARELGQPKLLLRDALYPAWISDSEFLFLSSDGLYKYSLKDNKSIKIWSLRGSASANDRFVLSPNGRKLAWSFVDDSTIVVLEFVKKDILKELSVNKAQVLDMLWTDDIHLLVVANTINKKFEAMILDTEKGRILQGNLKALDVDSIIKRCDKLFFLDYLK